MTDKDLDELTSAVYQRLVGLPFMDADAALDEARRTLWACAFTGKQIPDALEGLPYTIARRLVHLPLDWVSQVLEGVRLTVWLEVFPSVPQNLFGGLLDSATVQQ